MGGVPPRKRGFPFSRWFRRSPGLGGGEGEEGGASEWKELGGLSPAGMSTLCKGDSFRSPHRDSFPLSLCNRGGERVIRLQHAGMEY